MEGVEARGKRYSTSAVKWLAALVLSLSQAGASLVTVEVDVSDASTGRPVTDLRTRDFRIFDNGVERSIDFFDFDAAPLDLVVIPDIHGWLMPKDRNEVLGSVRLALTELHASDRVAVLWKQRSAAFTSDLDQAYTALLRARGEKGKLFDAIAAAADLFGPRGGTLRRRAVLALTEDAESRSKLGRDPVIRALLEKDASVSALVVIAGSGVTVGSTVGVPIPGVPSWVWQRKVNDLPEHWKSVKPVVEETGGEFIPLDESPYRLRELMARLRHRYLLAFYAAPSASPEYHQLRITLWEGAAIGRPEMVVRARKGYYPVPK